jgi:hypothetical protein
MGALKQFVEILLKPDNIPIAGMLVLVLYFTYLALRQALLNDRLIAEGREDEILKHMQGQGPEIRMPFTISPRTTGWRLREALSPGDHRRRILLHRSGPVSIAGHAGSMSGRRQPTRMGTSPKGSGKIAHRHASGMQRCGCASTSPSTASRRHGNGGLWAWW